MSPLAGAGQGDRTFETDTPKALLLCATYNQLPSLRLALRGYLRQTRRDFHLTIADDGSGPATTRFLAKIAPVFAARGIGFQHVWQEDKGFRKTRVLNQSVRSSPAAPLLIFSDGDCIPPARFIERHLAVHEPMSFHVGGAFRLDAETSKAIGEEQVDDGSYEGLGSAANGRELRKKASQSRWGTWVRRRHRPKVLGLNMAFDRALFEALNGFDERFQSWGFEDSDLRDRAMRLRPRPRVKVLYTKNDVYHLWHAGGANQRAQSRAYYKTRRPVRCEQGLRAG